jgi:hypothetical protein
MPTPRHVIERWGDQWTRREHIVNNGAFHLAYWKQNERFEFTPNPRYWDAAHVRLKKIVGYTPDGISTAANIYKAGMIDWNPSGNIPSPFLPYMRAFRDYRQAPYQSLYYYSINTTRKPFDNVWVRRALTYAVDRDAIARDLLKGTRIAWGNFTPMGYPGYQPPPPVTFDPARARACLARAGYPTARASEARDPVQHERGPPAHRRGDPGNVAQGAAHRRHAHEPGVGVVPQGDDRAAVRGRAPQLDRRLPRSQLVPGVLRQRRRQQPHGLEQRALRPARPRRRLRARRGEAPAHPA